MADQSTSSDSTTTTTTTAAPANTGDANLGDAGKKAIDDERAARRASDKAARDAGTELERLRAELKKRDDADLSEMEKLRKQVADAESQRQTFEQDRKAERTRHTIEREAGRMRFADPADAVSLIDPARIDFDAKGNPTNVPALLAELVKAKPYLSARPGTGSGEGGARGAAGGAGGGFSMDDYIRRAAGR
jgi:hypothetical protein